MELRGQRHAPDDDSRILTVLCSYHKYSHGWLAIAGVATVSSKHRRMSSVKLKYLGFFAKKTRFYFLSPTVGENYAP